MDRNTLLRGHGLAHRPTLIGPSTPVDFAQSAPAAPRLAFSELYATKGILGLRLTDKARDLSGRTVIVRGYMAPPLEDAGDFFVLTRNPVPACPFCDTNASWPDDVVVTMLRKESGFIDPFQPIEIAGVLDVGRQLDERTGSARLLRLVDASWRLLPPLAAAGA